MRIAVDTNVIVRLFVDDDTEQADRAVNAVAGRDRVALPITAVCEAVWVWRSIYRFERAAVRRALHALLEIPSVAVDRPAMAAGLAFLDAGADFADGVIGFQGLALGGETFVTFDAEAAQAARRVGWQARIPD